LALQLVSGSKKGQRTLAIQIARAAGLKLFCAFSPSEKRFAFLRRPQITLEAFSMMGEALRRETYHTEKTRQENFILKICVNTIFACETWSSGNSRESFTKKPSLIRRITAAASLSDFSQSSFPL